ncbi:hypothetical protein LC605_17140, partial [Nostoc sp. CHAB 5836]|nr:hypothetical protein [Nostoc sp. CHAB 5836]
GKTIEYLVNHQSKKSAGELTMEAVTSYWLIEALVGKVSKEELCFHCVGAFSLIYEYPCVIRTQIIHPLESGD